MPDDAKKPIAYSDTIQERAEIFRKLVQHEDNLQNNRFTWFSGFQALLFAALGLTVKEGAPTFITPVICVIGGVAALSSFAALRLSDFAYSQLEQKWREQIANEGYIGAPRQGHTFGDAGATEHSSQSHGFWPLVCLVLMPSRLLPLTCLLGWIVILVRLKWSW